MYLNYTLRNIFYLEFFFFLIFFKPIQINDNLSQHFYIFRFLHT